MPALAPAADGDDSDAGHPPAGDGHGSRWAPAGPGGLWLACGRHGAGPGRLDERARRLSHEELGVAELLAGDGHDVRSLAESRRGARRPDLEVCGAFVEVKSFLPAAERDRPPSGRSVYNKLLDGAGQARAVVLYGPGSGLTPAAVRSGLARLTIDGRARRLSAVRAVGDGFDLSWVRQPLVSRRLGQGARPPSRETGPKLGL